MGKKADYSAGTGKRWSVIIGILVLIAIVVVVIILAIPPNTYNAVETLNRSSQTGYLTSSSEKAEFDKFKTKISSSIVSDYQRELSDMEDLAVLVDDILNFHNDYLVFAKDNKTFKQNYKDIKNGLNDAKESQKKMNKILADTNVLSDESSTYLQSAMVDFREEFLIWLKSISRAVGGLENTYSGSLGEVTFNNPASTLILNTVNDYMSVLVADYEKLVELDVKGGNIEEYKENYFNLNITSKIKYFEKFSKRYLYNYYSNFAIQRYYFDTNVQNDFALYNEFFTLYAVEDATELIASISLNGITKTYEGVTDEIGAYSAIRLFVQGGL